MDGIEPPTFARIERAYSATELHPPRSDDESGSDPDDMNGECTIYTFTGYGARSRLALLLTSSPHGERQGVGLTI